MRSDGIGEFAVYSEVLCWEPTYTNKAEYWRAYLACGHYRTFGQNGNGDGKPIRCEKCERDEGKDAECVRLIETHPRWFGREPTKENNAMDKISEGDKAAMWWGQAMREVKVNDIPMPGDSAMAKHTEGPWEISQNANGDYDICTAGGGDMLADLSGCSNAQANARLIAAAPELLAALQHVYENIEYGHEAIVDANEIARAIAKATGLTES